MGDTIPRLVGLSYQRKVLKSGEASQKASCLCTEEPIVSSILESLDDGLQPVAKQPFFSELFWSVFYHSIREAS